MTTFPRSVEQRARNMAAMMDHLGIWPKDSFAGLPMEKAIHTCFLCYRGSRCSHWLADPDADPAGWQQFCPNAELFARLRGQSGSAAASCTVRQPGASSRYSAA